MNKKRMLLLVVVAALLISAVVMAEIRTHPRITIIRANLSSSKTAVLLVGAKETCESIGTTRYILYRSDGTVVKSETIKDYGSNKRKHTTTVNLSGVIKNGNSYYIVAYFYADGSTATVTSTTKAY